MKPIYSSSVLSIWAIPSGPFETNCYVISYTPTKTAIVIDPAPGAYESVLQIVTTHSLFLSGIVLTHSHWDHIADVSKLKSKYPHLSISVHENDVPNLESPGSDQLPCWIEIEPAQPTRILKEGDQVAVGSSEFTVLHTPGHSPGCICLYNEKENILFSGDTLFQGTYGNTSFPTSEPQKMRASLARLAQLPDTTVVFPGHGELTTIGKEKRWLRTV